MKSEYLACGSCTLNGSCDFLREYGSRGNGYLRSIPQGQDAGMAFVSAHCGVPNLDAVEKCEYTPFAKQSAEGLGQQLQEIVGGMAVAAA